MNETCTDCGERAICEYDWGTGQRRGCPAHDPLRFPYGSGVGRVPLYYRTTAFPIATTTSHLGNVGMTPPDRVTIGITPPWRMTATAGTCTP